MKRLSALIFICGLASAAVVAQTPVPTGDAEQERVREVIGQESAPGAQSGEIERVRELERVEEAGGEPANQQRTGTPGEGKGDQNWKYHGKGDPAQSGKSAPAGSKNRPQKSGK
ncbi:hypothetical protein E4634_10465 [Mangrovimicrobium sediminis]|uniref:Uncharacterized protein n=1 Tax=Mangrovimicrobium sediminis TaxID=2562682 RepID=A0A4Z0M1P4_9GAMM|nr:hypothetical protein [Haliea sp. SAOS-164]TGD73449.1 hypothetical protein E4634_10465 [Haliea sp. SAOS-164]